MDLLVFTKKLFKKEEIGSLEIINFSFETRSKIIVFVPAENLIGVMKAMAKAGAGEIGKYKYCSFNTQGVGSFLPLANSKPVTGKKGMINFVDEIKLEMECAIDKTDNVLDVMLQTHPYEEAAYEVYEFRKRTKDPSILLLTLKKSIKLKELFSRINKNIDLSELPVSKSIKKILVYQSSININKDLNVRIKRDADIQPGNKSSFNLILK